MKGIKKIFCNCFLSSFTVFLLAGSYPALMYSQSELELLPVALSDEILELDSIPPEPVPVAMDPEELFSNIKEYDFDKTLVNKSFIPRVFSGYRHTAHKPYDFSNPDIISGLRIMTKDTTSYIEEYEALLESEMLNPDDFIFDNNEIESLVGNRITESVVEEPQEKYPVTQEGKLPKWLQDALWSNRIQEDFLYNYMIYNPMSIEVADWDLPEPPQLIEDDVTFMSYIKKLRLPEIEIDKAIIPENEISKIYWLHTFGTALQFSQAYVSPNWYQGGNNYLSLLFNFNWNVQLNQVFHPNILFQSDFNYKLALSSNQKGSLHKYKIAEDVLQYNLNTGLKAFKKWYYSFNMLFKTQLLNNYEENTMVRTASFLSPGDLNMGLGMSFSHQDKLKTFQMTLTISPLSYNLKTCISNKVNHENFNISPFRKSKSEIGSNAELNFNWKITPYISYKSRMFLFSDYSYFLSDWENTFSFEINKFLSTQLYLHLRYDSSAEKNTGWKTFMMREILSFGLSYTFSTKPK